MPKTMFALSFGFVALIFATHHAFAATNCADRSSVLSELAGEYRESRQAMGLSGNSMIMELFASTDTGSWTITVTTPDGTTCLVASGGGFQSVTENLGPEGDPA